MILKFIKSLFQKTIVDEICSLIKEDKFIELIPQGKIYIPHLYCFNYENIQLDAYIDVYSDCYSVKLYIDKKEYHLNYWEELRIKITFNNNISVWKTNNAAILTDIINQNNLKSKTESNNNN
jgi:hypothetical protein